MTYQQGDLILEPVNTAKSVWGQRIPGINKAFMKVSVGLVFVLDLAILLLSGFSLLIFWVAMLVVFAIFAAFFYLENYVLSKKFTDTKSVLDHWIVAIIIVRNIVFILNYIPLIQLLGLSLLGGFLTILPSDFMGLGLGGPGNLNGLGLIAPLLFVLYVTLIISRFASARRSV